MVDAEFEARVLRFERAWQSGGPTPIAPHLAGLTLDDPDRRRLLVELIALDLEYHARRAPGDGPAALVGYVAQFPELGAVDQLPLDLVGEAYRARLRWGDRPAHADFLAQLPARHSAIESVLGQIDAEMINEGTPPLAGLEEPIPDATWSDRDFLLRRLIGAGGMGKVYEASLRAGSRRVAVKFLRKPLLARPEVVRSFLGEARIVARLRHPRIVATEGFGRTLGGSYFVVMDLVAGPDLDRMIRDRVIAPPEAVRWSTQLCEALEHSHESGVVHCDLKPANLILDAAGMVRVTDFGLARSLGDPDTGDLGITGTAPFMAPEQVDPTLGPIDERTDVYGVGAVLYTLLTGRPPREGRHIGDSRAGTWDAAPIAALISLRPDIPEPLSDLCRRCLAREPADRFADARTLRLALEAQGSTKPG